MSNKMPLDMKCTHNKIISVSPELWSGMASYTRAKELVAGLKVVNDCAERGVSLVQDYTNCLTRDEEQRQFLLQLVADLPQTAKANKG